MAAKVYLPIELSYKFLQHPDIKACFLFCCSYPEDAEISIEELVQYGVGTRFIRSRYTMEAARARVSTIVGTLRTSCLLLEGRDENSVKMHDIIRDVATSIASKDTQLMLLVKTGVQRWPDKEELKWCGALSLMLESIEVLPDELECPELRTLVLECSNRNWVRGLDGFFKRTKKLEVLSLHMITLSTATRSSISDLVNLRMLCLHKCALESIAFVEELKNLEILSLKGSEIYTLSLEVGKLTKLRVLDLRGCCLYEISSGIISSLSNLEELYTSCTLSEFFNWDKHGNASIGELNSLHHLTNLETCIPAKALSSQDLQCATSLIRFKISMGCQFFKDETHFETRMLQLSGIELIGGTKVLMKKAEVLYLDEPEGLQEVLQNIDGEWFLDLKFLQIGYHKDEMEHLLGKPKWNSPDPSPNPIPSPLGKLSILRVYKCSFKSLFSPSAVRSLPQLQEVEVKGCESMVEIVVGDDEQVGDEVLIFPQLKQISLCHLPNLRSFYANTTTHALFSEKVSFPFLEKLVIKDLKSITTVWENQLNLKGADSFQGLQNFGVCQCSKQVNMIGSFVFPKFQYLVDLHVLNCPSLTSIIEVVNITEGSEIQ